MAILDFLNKKKEESPEPAQSFTPKTTPLRGPGGEFVSKKKAVAHPVKKVDQTKVQGPFMAPFAGKEIRKFYFKRKWYYSIEDLVLLLNADPPLKPLVQLKREKDFEEVFPTEIYLEQTKSYEEKISKENLDLVRNYFRKTAEENN